MKDTTTKKENYYSSIVSCLQSKDVNEEIEIGSAVVQVQTVHNIINVLPMPCDVTGSCLLFSAVSKTKHSGSNNMADCSAAEYEGSPLKLRSCVDYDDIDRQIAEPSEKVRVRHKDMLHVAPLPSKVARECLSAAMLSRGHLNHPVICLCTPSESKRRTVAIGSYCQSGDNHMFDMTYEEITPDVCENKYKTLLREEKRRFIPANDHIITHASAQFKLLTASSSALRDNSTEHMNETAECTSVSVCVEWSHVNTLLMMPPPQCTATLNVQVVCGDKSSLVFSLYEQLQCLKELTTGLSSGRINWPEVVRTTLPLEQTKKLLGSQSYMEEEEEECHTAAVEPRRNLDFTDRLWNILIECQTYGELLEVMKYVMDSVSSKQCSPLMVSGTNSNPLAKWIYSQQIGETEGLLDLGSLQALVYFIEMGVEKLTKDYIHAYLGNFSGLVTVDKLQRFTKKSVSIQDKITDLYKLHTVLELSAFLHSTLQLPLSTVRASTATALKHLADNNSFPKQGFELTTTVASISDMISLDDLELWQMSLVAANSSPTKVRISRAEPNHCIALPAGSSDEVFHCCVLRQHQLEHCLSV